MPRGGKREGAGRPTGTGKFGEPTKSIRIPLSDWPRALDHIYNRFFKLPLFQSQVAAGLPTNADDQIEKRTDLNELFIKKPKDTFLVKVNGLSMINAGIQNGDILLVDSTAEPKNGKIVIAAINGEITVKRLQAKGKKIYLKAENAAFAPIEILKEMNFKILGTVTHVIHDLQKCR